MCVRFMVGWWVGFWFAEMAYKFCANTEVIDSTNHQRYLRQYVLALYFCFLLYITYCTGVTKSYYTLFDFE